MNESVESISPKETKRYILSSMDRLILFWRLDRTNPKTYEVYEEYVSKYEEYLNEWGLTDLLIKLCSHGDMLIQQNIILNTITKTDNELILKTVKEANSTYKNYRKWMNVHNRVTFGVMCLCFHAIPLGGLNVQIVSEFIQNTEYIRSGPFQPRVLVSDPLSWWKEKIWFALTVSWLGDNDHYCIKNVLSYIRTRAPTLFADMKGICNWYFWFKKVTGFMKNNLKQSFLRAQVMAWSPPNLK